MEKEIRVTEAEAKIIIDNCNPPLRFAGGFGELTDQSVYTFHYWLFKEPGGGYKLVHKTAIPSDILAGITTRWVSERVIEQAVVEIFNVLNKTETGRMTFAHFPEICKIITNAALSSK